MRKHLLMMQKHAVDRYNWTDIPESIHVSSNAVDQSNSAIDALNSIPRYISSTINSNFFSNEHAQRRTYRRVC